MLREEKKRTTNSGWRFLKPSSALPAWLRITAEKNTSVMMKKRRRVSTNVPVGISFTATRTARVINLRVI